MTAADLLRKENKARLVKAIGAAEKNTSGEIRVHLEHVCKGDPYLRAAYVFSRLGMFDTKDRNGVLIYLAMKSHKFAIVGDSGINARVGAGFWNDVKDAMAMRTIRTITRCLSVLCAALAVFVSTAAAQVPEKPAVPRAVNDFAGIFSVPDAEYMNRVLVSFADSTSNRIVVVTVNDLGGMEPAMFAYEIGEQWGVGSSKFDNGVVVLVKPKTASSSGQVYIAVGYGLEGAIPDAIAKRIVENEMIPRFKENDYAGGVAAALNVLMRGVCQ